MPHTPQKHRILTLIRGRLRADFHLSVVCILGVFVTLTLSPFVVFRALEGQWIIFFLDLCMVIATIGIASYGWLTRNSQAAAMIMATSISCGFVLTTFNNNEVSPYWLYAMVLFSFSLVPPRHAALLSCFGFCAVITHPSTFPSIVHVTTFSITLGATALFSYIFAKRNEYQRQALVEIARTDVLTNIGNRRAFNEEFAIALANVRRLKYRIAVALLDIDYFKSINDNYGHESGDNVLMAMTEVIKNNIRPQDRLFRVGGEEFCLIITNIEETPVKDSMNRLRKVLAHSQLIAHKQVTVSMGVTHITAKDSLESCLKRADEGLYEAKNNGRNQVVYKEPY
ncbi:GGDEF domain-containing protein [Marinagarivorans algicola]|uniref:GGDEF domain-containing protein n=1 Tax=Marinagarivorans algicola TaxID=1513270 RepID=UPI0012E220F4|nr:GGDEF domain-containing protein [Marinagarivorans algicola]